MIVDPPDIWYPQRKPRCKHAAGIWYRDNLMSVGYNVLKSHPLQARFSDRPHRIFMHAEISALVNFLRLYPHHMLQHSDLVVIRIDAEGNYAPSKPCLGCQRALSSFELRDVAWS